MPRTLKYRLFFGRTARGQCPVREFLRGLPRKDRLKCVFYLHRVRVYGTGQPSIYVEKLDANLWEAKPEYNNIEYRFFFGVIGPGRIGVVSALKKKRMRLPRPVLAHAASLVAEMQERDRP